MSDDDYDDGFDSDDTFSAQVAFDMDEYNLRGLRIYVGPRRESSVDGEDPFNTACECRCEWKMADTDDSDVVRFEAEQRASLGFDRSFIHPDGPIAQQMGQAIDLALRMMETQKSINIMIRVAQRLFVECPGNMYHNITPGSTWDQIQTLVRAWMAKLRHEEFFKIQMVPRAKLDGSNSGLHLRHWPRFVMENSELATLADYKPHNAGMLLIDVKIVEKLVRHAASSHPCSPTERQKCLFHVANLIINQVQRFWVAFLVKDRTAEITSKEPFAVYSEATKGLFDVYNGVNAGYHWDAEFFGGVVHMWHNIHNPSTDFNQHGGFGRNLSIGDAYLNRPDGSEQLVWIDSIIRCTSYDFSDVCQNGLRVVGPRVPPLSFDLVDYSLDA